MILLFTIAIVAAMMIPSSVFDTLYETSGTAQAQLTTGDIAKLTPEQRYTLDQIKDAVIRFDLLGNGTENTSTLTNDEVSLQIFEYFVNEGTVLCNNVEDRWFCMDSYEKSLLEIYNDTITEQYNQIVADNQNEKSLLDFIFWIVSSLYLSY